MSQENISLNLYDKKDMAELDFRAGNGEPAGTNSPYDSDSIFHSGEDGEEFLPHATLLNLMEANDAFREREIALDPRLAQFFPAEPVNESLGNSEQPPRSPSRNRQSS